MEFRDLKKQYLALKENIDVGIQEVLNNANYISGMQIAELEKEMEEYVGVKHCITCGNGTDALSLALMVWNIGKNDAVFVPDFTFFASGEVVSLAGATPVFVDVEKETYNISPAKLVEKIEEVLDMGNLNPKAIISVDLFGQPSNYIQLRKIANQYNLLILEDGAQGFGGRIGNRRACSFGDISTTSFFPAKPLGCYGDGGAIFTDNDEWAELLRSYCIHGKGKSKYDNIRIGMNSRLDTLQAAILKIKLRAFKEYELDKVNQLAALYTRLLKGVVNIPVICGDFYSSWAQYTIQLENAEQRKLLQDALKKKAIPSMVYYEKVLHNQKAFHLCQKTKNDYKISELLANTVLSLPIHPYMDDEEVLKVCDTIKTTIL